MGIKLEKFKIEFDNTIPRKCFWVFFNMLHNGYVYRADLENLKKKIETALADQDLWLAAEDVAKEKNKSDKENSHGDQC